MILVLVHCAVARTQNIQREIDEDVHMLRTIMTVSSQLVAYDNYKNKNRAMGRGGIGGAVPEYHVRQQTT